VEGSSAPEYPLQKKHHSVEFVRSVANFAREEFFSARLPHRYVAAHAIHGFFQERGFDMSYAIITARL
jgi:asparaginyl-tRNA synthetase